MRRPAVIVMRIAAACGLLTGPTVVAALDPSLTLSQLKHDRWSTENGMPTNVRSMVQSKDGFLWLGATSGLYRFDGISFEHVAMPQASGRSPSVVSLAAARNGGVWVGLKAGGVLLYRDGAWSAPPSMPFVASP